MCEIRERSYGGVRLRRTLGEFAMVARSNLGDSSIFYYQNWLFQVFQRGEERGGCEGNHEVNLVWKIGLKLRFTNNPLLKALA